jgi:hypothetical protein
MFFHEARKKVMVTVMPRPFLLGHHLNWPREQEDFSFQDDLGVIKAQRVAVLVGRLPPLRRPLHWFECVRVLKEAPRDGHCKRQRER